jgi:hypothetical protein
MDPTVRLLTGASAFTLSLDDSTHAPRPQDARVGEDLTSDLNRRVAPENDAPRRVASDRFVGFQPLLTASPR